MDGRICLRRLGYGLSTFLAAGLVSVACAPPRAIGSATPTPGPLSPAVGFLAPLAPSCVALPVQTPFAEVKGSHLWALVFGSLPIKARTNTKIVWRMGGSGTFDIGAKRTNGSSAQLTFGPEFHISSDWNIPKTDEWGTGFIFPTAGCWRVHASRGATTGDVYFLIAEP